jgi:predicted Fe-Mo cluster-binding NifX family protein
MRIAIPIWNNKISPVFDTALNLLVLDIEDGCVTARSVKSMQGKDLNRRCSHINELGVDVLICGAISHNLHGMLSSQGVDVIEEISGFADDIVDAYLKGNLLDSEYMMPWCKRKRREHCRRDKSIMKRRF